jgi:hypothetical protein
LTAQIPEKLVNNAENIDFGEFHIHSICVSKPADFNNWKGYPFKNKGNMDKFVASSACWRGYVSVYELAPSGELTLIRFEYPFGREKREHDKVNELLVGNFWLELRESFFGSKMFIPFKDGKIVDDESEWILQNKPNENNKRTAIWIFQNITLRRGK